MSTIQFVLEVPARKVLPALVDLGYRCIDPRTGTGSVSWTDYSIYLGNLPYTPLVAPDIWNAPPGMVHRAILDAVRGEPVMVDYYGPPSGTPVTTFLTFPSYTEIDDRGTTRLHWKRMHCGLSTWGSYWREFERLYDQFEQRGLPIRWSED